MSVSYLLQNRNPYGDHFYTARRNKIRIIVLHITAGLEDIDLVGPDKSAENTARYASNTSRLVSWHKGVDSDSIIQLIPDSYTAWHCKGFNSSSLGLEISKTHVKWSGMPKNWVRATIANAAEVCKDWARRYGIPLTRISRGQALAGASGFLYHSDADPGRRRDPGADFPLDMLFGYIRGSAGLYVPSVPSPKDADMITPNSQRQAIRIMQSDLDWVWYNLISREDRYNHAAATKQWGLHEAPEDGGGCGDDGLWGPATQAVFARVAERLNWYVPDVENASYEFWMQDHIRQYQSQVEVG